MKFNHTKYKQRNITIWNEVAPRYHKRWASINQGPFQSTSKLIQVLEVSKGDLVLDLACGTGVVTKNIRQEIGHLGYVVGGDTSITAIKTAKKWIGSQLNLDFVNIDAENFSFSKQFDIITCQYGLFFFPNAQKVTLTEVNFAGNTYIYESAGVNEIHSASTPGEFQMISSGASGAVAILKTDPTASLEAGEEATILFALESGVANGRDAQFKIKTATGAIFVGTVLAGQQSG